MYNQDRVRERFLREVSRLLEERIATSGAQISRVCGKYEGYVVDLQGGRIKQINLGVLYNFVNAYRSHGVTYEAILEGKPLKPVTYQPPALALNKLKDARRELTDALTMLTRA